MSDPVLNIPAPILQVAKKLHETLKYGEVGVSLEDVLLLCLVDGMEKRWDAIRIYMGQSPEVEKIIKEVNKSEGMKYILSFLASIERKSESGTNE